MFPSFSATTSTNPRYHSYLFDKQTNLAANHCDTRIFLNRGLQIGSDSNGGLAVRGEGGDNLLGSIDSNKTVKGLCASNFYIAMDFFNTYTCNQLLHFGVKGIKSWVDSNEWCGNYKGFYHYKGSLTTPDCHEIVNWIVMKNVQFVTSIQLEALRCLVFWTECIKAPMEDNFRSPADLPESSQENREVMEFTQPPYIVCTCEVGDTGAMFSLTPGFPYQATIA